MAAVSHVIKHASSMESMATLIVPLYRMDPANVSIVLSILDKRFIWIILVPTLAFVCHRADEIKSFKPTPYWKLAAVIAPDNTTRQYLNVDSMAEREFNHGAIKGLHNSLKDSKQGTVISIKKITRSTAKPKALNTVEMRMFLI